MPLGTLDRTPPPFFKQGPSALSKLVVCGALALFLMVADQRFDVMQPVRTALATMLYPLQWTVMQPVNLVRGAGRYMTSLHAAQQGEAQARAQLAVQAERSQQVELLTLENQRLRALLDMHERLQTHSMGAQVLYDAADPYSRKVMIDQGLTHGVEAGSPVIDDQGVLGQVTRVYPLVSEVTLLVDHDQIIPVLNARTGARYVAFGQPGEKGDGLELRYTLSSADIDEGDLLVTSGVDGVYPAGLPVARVTRVERRAESSFNRILCEPLARIDGVLQVLVLSPVDAQLPPRPAEETTARARPAAGPGRPGGGQP